MELIEDTRLSVRRSIRKGDCLLGLLAVLFIVGASVSSVYARHREENDDSSDEEETSSVSQPNWALQAEYCDAKLPTAPKDNRLWEQLVDARIHLGDFRRAEEALKIWRHNVPKLPKADPVVDRLEGDLAFARQDVAGAVAAWRRYLHLAPRDADAWDRLASALEALGDFRGAVDAVSGVLKLKPDAAHYAKRAHSFIRLRDWARASADLQEGNKLDATNSEIQALYPIFERQAEWMPKLQALDRAVQKQRGKGGEAAALLERTDFLDQQGWYDLADEDASKAFALAPHSLEAQLWKGVLGWQLRNKGEVLNVWATDADNRNAKWRGIVVSIDRETDPEVRAASLVELGQLGLALAQVESVDGAVVKAEVLEKLQQHPRAVQAAKRAVEVHPQDAIAWVVLAHCDFIDGNLKEAVQEIEHARQLDATVDDEGVRAQALRMLQAQ